MNGKRFISVELEKTEALALPLPYFLLRNFFLKIYFIWIPFILILAVILMENIQDTEDIHVIARIQGGQKADFEFLYKKYLPQVLRFANRMVRSTDIAEEIAQESFIKLYTHIDRYRPGKAKFSTYLFQITYNTALNFIRSQKRERESIKKMKEEFDVQPSYSDPYKQVERKEITQYVKSLIADLPPPEDTIFMLKTEKNMKYEEIAQVLSISRRTVIRKMNSAVSRLQKAMKSSHII
ncbi:MAG: sigma-70 family RNA polymerase sigma factor [Spirochaetes bacterium]|nr:sigma-70 family RNA polymerase sigma factor [Spirochaetota bacterium]